MTYQGITIYGNGVSYSNADNTITRYIRFRMGRGGAHTPFSSMDTHP